MAASKTPTKRKRPARRKRATVAQAREALADQPLIGLTAAAGVLGIAPPNVSRLRAQGRMPEGVELVGGAMVYFESEIQTLAGELERERNKRP